MTYFRRTVLHGFAAAFLVVPTHLPAQAPIPIDNPPSWDARPGYFKSVVGNLVFFDFDHSDLSKEAKAALDKQIAWLKSYPDYDVTLEGHVDDGLSPEYSLAIGQKRAEAVKAYMVMQGFLPQRIKVISYGTSRPLDNSGTKAAKARNRYVETQLSPRLDQ